ncbi:MAG: YeeE/YedE family protein [Deltaproteobacteria bacterium]|nr:YeeE/YedE family protein [Deltaproteobacteria bacterium]
MKPKPLHKGTVIGSVLFGVGWAITGLCPGPIFVGIGEGKLYALVTLAGVFAGTTLLGVAHPKLSALMGVAPPEAK